MNLRSLSLFFVLGLLWSVLAQGLEDDRDKPIQLEADRARLDQKSGVSVYEGNVMITQGSMRLAADTVTVYVENGVFQRMEAQGSPAKFQVKPAPEKADIHGEGRQINYDAANNKLIITTNAKVTQERAVFKGGRIEYDLLKDQVNAKGAGEGGRIQIILPSQSTPSPKQQ